MPYSATATATATRLLLAAIEAFEGLNLGAKAPTAAWSVMEVAVIRIVCWQAKFASVVKLLLVNPIVT